MDGARDWTIEAAGEADLPAVLALWRDAESEPTATDSELGLRLLLRSAPGSLLVARADGRLVGSLIAAWDGWRGSFYRLAVDPEWRRRGVAGSLVEAGERRLVEMGAMRLTAIVVSTAPDAMGLWESLGFELQSERSRFVRNLGAGEG